MATARTSGAILVYEDDAVCAQALASVLRHAGHTAQAVTHFQPALRALETDLHIDALVADVVFPAGGVNGMVLARMGRMKHPDLKVVHVTGYDFDHLAQMASGPILRKPVSNQILLFWIQRALTCSQQFWWP